MNVKFLVSFLFLTFTSIVFGQEKLITGSVKDEKQQPLSGVVVSVKETGKQTQTDNSGIYTISASAGNTIIFTAKGFGGQSFIVDTANTTINVVLKAGDSGQAVTAMGIARDAKALGYETQSVEGGKGAVTQDASSALAGNATGVQVKAASAMGGAANVEVRGKGTLTGSNAPLVVVDGVPMGDGAAADINPDDIESTTVLKGGAASALYGSRGGNGVILYTTKSGKGGKTSIDVKSSVTFESIAIYPNFQNEYGGGKDINWDPKKNVWTNPDTGKVYNIPGYEYDESWGPKLDGRPYLPWSAFDKDIPELYMKEQPWSMPKHTMEDFFRTGATYMNSISVSRSASGTNIRMSLGNNKTLGIVPNADMSKTNVGFSMSSQLNKRLKIDGSFNYVFSETKNEHHQYATDNEMSRIIFGWFQRNLDFDELKRYKSPSGRHRSWNITGPTNFNPKWADNPYWTVYENTWEKRRQRFYGNIGFKYNFRDDLYAVGKINGDLFNTKKKEIRAVGSEGSDEPYFYMGNSDFSNYNYEFRLHYEPKISEDFTLTSFVGASRNQVKTSYAQGISMNGLVVENFYNLVNSVNAAKGSNGETWKRTNSVYGMASLGYKDTYFLEATGRKDWFSTVVEPVFYPSFTGSFVFSNLLGDNVKRVITSGKLRGAWAQAGNDTGPYRLVDYANYNNPFNGMKNNSLSATKNNSNLKPEVKSTVEGGIDLGLFNNVNLSFTYYDTRTKDLIIPLPLDPSTGYVDMYINTGSLQNKGIEASVSATPVSTGDFQWNTSLNFTQNKNTLLELYHDVKEQQLASSWQTTLIAKVGEPYGVIMGTDHVYLNGQKVVDSEGFYKATDEKVALGNVNPDFNLGFNNTFSYNNITLSVLFDYQHGGSFYAFSHALGMWTGILDETVDYQGQKVREGKFVLPGVNEDGKPNDVVLTPDKLSKWGQSFVRGGVDAQSVFDASYLKLRDVTLSYELPLDKGTAIKGVNFTVFGRNLMTFGLDWKGMDPEVAGLSNGFEPENISLPSTRSYGLSVGLKL